MNDDRLRFRRAVAARFLAEVRLGRHLHPEGRHAGARPYIGEATEHTRITVGVGVCGTAVARNADMNVPDVSASDNYLACSVATKSELVVLIRDRAGAIVGQIDIDSHTRDAFGPDEERHVKAVADELGAAWPA